MDTPGGLSRAERAHLRRRRMLIGGILVASALVALVAVLHHHMEGAGDWLSRKSCLVVMRKFLELEAARLGHYPLRLSDVPEILKYNVPDGDTLGLAYDAAGLPYEESANQRLFHETQATDYGFKTGWFDVYHEEVVFHEE